MSFTSFSDLQRNGFVCDVQSLTYLQVLAFVPDYSFSVWLLTRRDVTSGDCNCFQWPSGSARIYFSPESILCDDQDELMQ